MINFFKKSKKYPQFEFGWATDRGKKRKASPNQDSLIILSSKGKTGNPPVLIIADGMGGYTGGAVASQIIIDEFKEAYASIKGPFNFGDYCNKTINVALNRMQEKAKTDNQFANMGSTIVVASILNNALHIMNVGDSRAYLIHKSEMRQVNYDHSFVGEAIRAGLITSTEAMTHPKRNQLTQSVSAHRIDVKPYFNEAVFDKDDILVLCSDGLWGVVSEATILAVVNELLPQAAAEKLIKLANSRGGPDNISVIVCKRTGAKPQISFEEIES